MNHRVKRCTVVVLVFCDSVGIIGRVEMRNEKSVRLDNRARALVEVGDTDKLIDPSI